MFNSRRGRFRWRTRIRRHLPWALINRGVADKGATDCGNHEWYRATEQVEHCYHCSVGHRPAMASGQ
ncbi:hypothetical protein Q0Z83_046620 [Actinoplanes sichuanensis]|uniref:Uncharacterized protein n=1 Tax=Actinoplanes sichuanensis TaxID=512349 RepID=A0ABW4AAP0_9ACTN|nr:hypothetical protein [Actinoplanes sichuanensis]BEL06471.1 hypothetical protein Q0Z83_046620 [Actinoplanes sichuanensis]